MARTGTVWLRIGVGGEVHGLRTWQNTKQLNRRDRLEERRIYNVRSVGEGSGESATGHDTSILQRGGSQ